MRRRPSFAPACSPAYRRQSGGQRRAAKGQNAWGAASIVSIDAQANHTGCIVTMFHYDLQSSSSMLKAIRREKRNGGVASRTHRRREQLGTAGARGGEP